MTGRALRLAALAALLLGLPAAAQEASGPQASVTLDPDGPVTVGTPVEVSVTLLVPSYMPKPPVWPDLQIADAITRLPDRATNPVTQRIGSESWSGISRTWEIVPQRPADFELGAATATVTYADPETNAPREVEVALPEIAFSATVPPGAEGIDPFLAATSLTLSAKIDGLSDAPKPGDAFTFTLTTTAEGPPAMLLPPLVEGLETPPGLRAYPRQPALADGPPASRTEAVTYVIEAPGSYALPALRVDWWNTAAASRETASTDPISLEVPAPAGWRPPGDAAGGLASPLRMWIAVVAALALALALAFLLRRRRHPPAEAREPSLRERRSALRSAVLEDSPGVIRLRLGEWRAALPGALPARDGDAIEAALAALDRAAYGPAGGRGSDEATRRRALLAAVDRAAPARSGAEAPRLPTLNPPVLPEASGRGAEA